MLLLCVVLVLFPALLLLWLPVSGTFWCTPEPVSYFRFLEVTLASSCFPASWEFPCSCFLLFTVVFALCGSLWFCFPKQLNLVNLAILVWFFMSSSFLALLGIFTSFLLSFLRQTFTATVLLPLPVRPDSVQHFSLNHVQHKQIIRISSICSEQESSLARPARCFSWTLLVCLCLPSPSATGPGWVLSSGSLSKEGFVPSLSVVIG